MITTRAQLERRAAEGDEAAGLALADTLDAEGRHHEALDVLAKAARLGGLTAGARLGARILVGDRAPQLGAEGAGLIEAAARGGGAEGAALLAVLAAAGAYRRQRWSEALDWLQRAAEQRFTPARGQLAVLTSDRTLAREARALSDEAPVGIWKRLRAAVDEASLVTPPAGVTLSADPAIRCFPHFASSETCAWIVARAGERLRRAEVHDGGAGRVSQTRTNTTRVFTLADTDLVQLALQMRIAAAAGLPFAHSEASSVLHYSVGQEFADHYDFVDPAMPDYAAHLATTGQRTATFLLYLNDDYEGGETEFPLLGIKHKGRKGEGLLFFNALPNGAPDERMLHAGRPPTLGEKWVASQFIRSLPIMPGAR